MATRIFMGRKIAAFPSFLALACASFSNCDLAVAQINPDNTLGSESSVVTPTDFNTELITGGATRGTSLFHSFRDFRVNLKKAAYFASPDNIRTIFSRVTGRNPSQILGVLGVEGEANLFLINPNGIIFGKDARLDIPGSFIATTANSQFNPSKIDSPPKVQRSSGKA